MPLTVTFPCEHPPDQSQTDRRSLEGTSQGDEKESYGPEYDKKPQEGIRGKMQRTDGSFSGEISLKAREEDWMMDHDANEQRYREEPLSYREALKPKTMREREQENMETSQEAWDGNLLFDNLEDISEGISIINSENGPVLTFSEEEKQRLERYWRNTLIVKLLGGTMGFMQMRRKVQAMWGKSGKVELNVIGNGFMLASFSSMEDYYFALEGGPWLIQDHYLTVQIWKRNFDPWNEKLNRVAVWVRLPRLPVDYYDRKFFYALGNQIGKAIKVDEMTYTKARTMYARMCVEVDLNAPLLPSYIVDGNNLKVEYEGLHLICFCCGRFGHNTEHCTSRKPASIGVSEGENFDRRELAGKQEEQRRQTEKKETSTYGEWMIVQEPKRGCRPTHRSLNSGEVQKKESMGNGGVGGMPRYAALEVEEMTGEGEETERSSRITLKNISNEDRARKEKSTSKGKEVITPVEIKRASNRGKKVADLRSEKTGTIITSLKDTEESTSGGKGRSQKESEKELKGRGLSCRDMGQVKAQNNGLDNGGLKGPQQEGGDNKMGLERKSINGPSAEISSGPGRDNWASMQGGKTDVMELDDNKPPDPSEPMEIFGPDKKGELDGKRLSNEEDEERLQEETARVEEQNK